MGDYRPLPERVRPQSLDEIVGQKILSSESKLRKLIESEQFSALLFWGPPGSGKTTLAKLIGATTQMPVEYVSAVHGTVKILRDIFAKSEQGIADGNKPTLLFLDEIHRLSKSQQDVLLPAIESGLIKLIGATTENPSFEVNAAVLSRSLVFRLEALAPEAIVAVLQRALAHPDAKLSRQDIALDLLKAIADACQGDARKALGVLEAVIASAGDQEGPLTTDDLRGLGDQFQRYYDKNRDDHYDTISAFIKSLRASHPDAALYYMARMIDAGEDPMFIARRLLIFAAEDVGNANPTALMLAQSGQQAVHSIGMPEARIVLAQVATYLASSPKSNRAYLGINKALEVVRKRGKLEIPLHLRNAPTKLMTQSGYGKGCAYPHDDLAGARQKPYLPRELKGAVFYQPTEIGVEKQLKANLEKLRPTLD